jgi:cofilin
MNTGTKPGEKEIEDFNNLKMKSLHRYIIFTIGPDDKGVETVQTEKIGELDSKWEEMVDALPKDDCRFIIYDIVYETDENPPRKTNKLALFLWSPDAAKTKRKFTFAGTKLEVKNIFTGIQKEFQVK